MKNTELPHRHNEGAETALIREQLDQVEDFQIVADIFKQLGDTTRIRIFWLLCHCEECVLNISAMLNMSSPAVSHHLRPLKASGLIVSRREGKEVWPPRRGHRTEQTFTPDDRTGHGDHLRILPQRIIPVRTLHPLFKYEYLPQNIIQRCGNHDHHHFADPVVHTEHIHQNNQPHEVNHPRESSSQHIANNLHHLSL